MRKEHDNFSNGLTVSFGICGVCIYPVRGIKKRNSSRNTREYIRREGLQQQRTEVFCVDRRMSPPVEDNFNVFR